MGHGNQIQGEGDGEIECLPDDSHPLGFTVPLANVSSLEETYAYLDQLALMRHQHQTTQDSTTLPPAELCTISKDVMNVLVSKGLKPRAVVVEESGGLSIQAGRDGAFISITLHEQIPSVLISAVSGSMLLCVVEVAIPALSETLNYLMQKYSEVYL